MKITITGYGLNEGRTITCKLSSTRPVKGKSLELIRLKVPAIGGSIIWTFNPGTGQQVGFPISGYRISPEDLKRIRESVPR